MICDGNYSDLSVVRDYYILCIVIDKVCVNYAYKKQILQKQSLNLVLELIFGHIYVLHLTKGKDQIYLIVMSKCRYNWTCLINVNLLLSEFWLVNCEISCLWIDARLDDLPSRQHLTLSSRTSIFAH